MTSPHPAPHPPRTLRGLLACRHYPIVYLNMPMSACTSCKNLLYRIDTGADYEDPPAIHADMDFLLRSNGSDPAAFEEAIANRKITFTLVRDPFTRCYSAFNAKIAHRHKYSFQKIRRFVADRYGADFESHAGGNSRERQSANFAAFLRFALDNLGRATPGIPPNPHWMSQKAILDGYRALCPVDFVGRAERFGAAMEYVLEIGGYRGDADLSKRFDEGPAAPFRFAEVMTEEVHSMLHQLYDADLAEFGYHCPRCDQAPRPALHLTGQRATVVGGRAQRATPHRVEQSSKQVS